MSRGSEFAEKLAAKLGYECVSREQLLEEATRRKIPVGKLETAIIKPYTFTERLAVEMEHYKALATSILCEKAMRTSIVYHGRTGHLLFPGIGNILRIRVVADLECRTQFVMERLGLSHAKAKRYIDQVEEDRRRWVRRFYGVEWDVFELYDLVLNLTDCNIDNAATAVCALVQLPEFQATPATERAVKDLYIASTARLMLATDPRTRRLNARVRTGHGTLHVIYPYQQAKEAVFIPQVLEGLEDVHEVVCTQAQTNILWIQEVFDPSEPAYKSILSLADTWDAAVEMIKFIPAAGPVPKACLPKEAPEPDDRWRETGIIEEPDDRPEEIAEDLSAVYQKLINDGRAGGRLVVQGDQKTLIGAIDRAASYRLVLFDEVFMSKGQEARTRMQQEWSNALSELLRVPVVTRKEIVSRYHFGTRQAVRMLAFALLAALIVFTVFRFDQEILTFLSQTELRWRALAAALIFAFVPTFAFVYSTVTGLFLKLIRLD
jgi:cytidylate kinase